MGKPTPVKAHSCRLLFNPHGVVMSEKQKDYPEPEGGVQEYDLRALAVAKALYEETLPETVILFGSRARGDYRVDSDIDLPVVTTDSGMSDDARIRGQREANRTAREV